MLSESQSELVATPSLYLLPINFATFSVWLLSLIVSFYQFLSVFVFSTSHYLSVSVSPLSFICSLLLFLPHLSCGQCLRNVSQSLLCPQKQYCFITHNALVSAPVKNSLNSDNSN